MTYDEIYDAVSDTYAPATAWERRVHAGEPASLNLAEEALGRHAGSEEIALRIRDFETGADEAHSFDELNAAANRAANFFEGTMERGERFGIMLPPRLELYAVLFGGIKSLRHFIPLDPKFGPDALSYRLADAEATTLVTTADHLDKVAPDAIPSLERILVVGGGEEPVGDLDVRPYDDVAAESGDYQAIRVHPSEPYGMSYSSGTTGQPTPHPSTHARVAAEAYMRFVVDLLEADTYFVAASPAWSYGLGAGTLAPGQFGTNIGAYRGRFDLEMWVDTLDRWDVTNAMVAPTALRQLRASDVDVDAYDVDLRVLVTAGETLDAGTAEWVEEHLGTVPIDAYGLTEGGMIVCNYPFADWEVKHGSMGKPVPGQDIRLVDPDASPEATHEDPAPTEAMTFVEGAGEVGEIAKYQSGGSGPMAGTQPVGWMRTGDLAEVDEDGYWWYRGRADEVIISAGYRIGPEEVQETLVDHAAVEEAGVIGVDHETRGNIVKAYVTLAPGHEPSDDLRAEITQFAKEELSKHEYPRELEFIDELPKTTSDKIVRRELAERHERERAN
ncbi:MAG: acyl-CoA synthetase [Haloarculaceae archaeon]